MHHPPTLRRELNLDNWPGGVEMGNGGAELRLGGQLMLDLQEVGSGKHHGRSGTVKGTILPTFFEIAAEHRCRGRVWWCSQRKFHGEFPDVNRAGFHASVKEVDIA